MEDDSLPCKDGFLLFPPHGMLGQLKKAWSRRRCQLFRGGRRGLPRLEVLDADAGQSQRIITLEDCVKVAADTPRAPPHAFTIVTKSGEHAAAADDGNEAAAWISALQSVAFAATVTFASAVEEYNDLYCSASEKSVFVFSVELAPTDASRRCGLTPGCYRLTAGQSELELCDEAGRQRASWPYRFIRRYGYRDGAFTLEAGRLCSTGEGAFRLEHAERRDIYRVIAARMRAYRASLAADDVSLAAVAGLEPRSRSPLPPGPPPAQLRPEKPPRRHVPPPPTYDSVEVRSDAWRTLGIDVVHPPRTHGGLAPSIAPTPSGAPAPFGACASFGALAPFGEVAAPGPAETTDDGDAYDTLKHLGPTSRPEPGYLRVPSLAVDSIRARLANDSHHGYGVIRKQPAHVLCNNTEYAVVAKPTRP